MSAPEVQTIDWPAAGIERAPDCPVCHSPDRALLHPDLEDRTFGAPGKWTMWRCTRCESAWLDPRPDTETIGMAYEEYYTHDQGVDEVAEAKSVPLRTRLGNGYRNWRYRATLRPASRLGIVVGTLLPPLAWATHATYRYLPRPGKGGKRVLDVGCGSGVFLELAREYGWIVKGAEPDPVAREVAAERGFEVRSSLAEWSGEAGQFDAVTLGHVIEHVHDPLSLLREIHALLRPGGMIFVETPNVDAIGHRLYGANWRGLEPPRHLVMFSSRSLRQVLRSAGFHGIRFHPRPGALAFTAPESRKIACELEASSSKEPDSSVPQPRVSDKMRALFGAAAEFHAITAVK